MPCHRLELEKREAQILAPYAQLSQATRGRIHSESPPDWRTQFQRDRDRVIHSRAFRRLEYKTQVFLNGSGDHLRTRLTHTMEVAAIARNIARALRLNEDLTETIALAHDLGHSPFGHNGEVVLDRLMAQHGGFEHNRQSLRVVEELEQKYPHFSGLNLSWEVREGLAKHQTTFDSPDPHQEYPFHNASLEAQVANLADEVTYYSHDLDDGLDSHLLVESELAKSLQLWNEASLWVSQTYGSLPSESRRYFIIRCLIDRQVKEIVYTTEAYLEEHQIHSADQARLHPHPVVQYSAGLKTANQELRKYLYQNLYFNPKVHQPNLRAGEMLQALFHYFVQHPEKMGEQAKRRWASHGIQRAVCDYLAGMTDRYAIQEYHRWITPASDPPLPSTPSP